VSYELPDNTSPFIWIKLGNWSTAQNGSTLLMTIAAHSGYNAGFNQNQVTEFYLATSNGVSNNAGFYANGGASRNTLLGTSSTAPETIRVVQVSTTSYDIWGYFAQWSGRSNYSVQINPTTSWTNISATGSTPSGTYLDITPQEITSGGGSGSGSSGTSGTSQNVVASYMRGSRSTQQTTNLTVGSLVAFNQTDNSTGSDISLNTSTGQITLAANRTYRLLAQVPTFEGNTGSRPSFRWYDETSSSYIGSLSAAYNPADNAAFGSFGGPADAVITTTQTTVVSFRITNATSLSRLGGSVDFITGGSYPWFDIEVISGHSPLVNGTSGSSGTSGTSPTGVAVSTVYPALLFASNNIDQNGVGNGTAISFQTTRASNGSLITKTSNTQVTLTGGKTYKMEAIIRRFTSNSSWGTFRWYDVTNATYVGVEGFGEVTTSSQNVSSTVIATHIVTPSVNTTYELRQTTVNTISVNANYATYEITELDPTIMVNDGTSGTTGTSGTSTPTTSLSLSESLTVTGTSSFNGLTVLQEVTEIINSTPAATASVVTYDFSTGSNWYHSSITTNYTANFTNIPTTDNRATTLTIVINQGATAYIPSVVQIAGASQTIKWAGGTASGTANQVDIVGFTFIRSGGSWAQVLGQINTFD
jgi:hypothetical protein